MATGERFATADLTTARIEVCKILDIGRRADQYQSNARLFLRLKKPESVRLVIRENPDWSDNSLAIPIRKDNQRIILEEALISLFWECFPHSHGLTITQATDILERAGLT